jgi:hypothetical protein
VSWTDNGGAGVDLAYLGDGSLHLGVNREADFVARSSSVIPESSRFRETTGGFAQ